MMQPIRQWLNKITCRLRGHRWHRGFFETLCDRCEAVKVDRLWQTHADEYSRQATLRAMKYCGYEPRYRHVESGAKINQSLNSE